MLDRRQFIGGAAALGAAGLLGTPGTASGHGGGGGRGLPRRESFVIRGAYVLSMDPAVGDVADGDVAVRDGRIVRYVADMTGFRDLLAYLMEDCCNGKPELCRPVIDAVTCRC